MRLPFLRTHALAVHSNTLPYFTDLPVSSSLYRIAGNFRGVLIFVNFVVHPGVTKFSTHENFPHSE